MGKTILQMSASIVTIMVLLLIIQLVGQISQQEQTVTTDNFAMELAPVIAVEHVLQAHLLVLLLLPVLLLPVMKQLIPAVM